MKSKIKITAAVAGNKETVYRSPDKYNLSITESCIAGDGSSKHPYQMHYKISNTSDTEWKGIVHIELLIPKKDPQFYLPGFMYRRNRGEAPQNTPVQFPRMREGEPNKPSSSWWMIRGDRLASPAALVYDSGMISGLCASPYWITKNGNREQWTPASESRQSGKAFYQYAGYSCKLENEFVENGDKYCSVGYTLGYENAPWLFVSSAHVYDREPITDANSFVIKPGEEVIVKINLFEYEAETETDIYNALDEVYTYFHEYPRYIESESYKDSKIEPNKDYILNAIGDLAGALYRDAWLSDEKCYSGFVYDDGSLNKLGSLTWTNGMSVAVPVLLSAIRLGDDNMRSQALTCINNIIGNCMNPASGLPYDAVNDGVWSVRGWWYDGMHTGGHAAYLTGQALYYVLKAYWFEKEKMKCIHEDWISFVKPVIDRINKEKNSVGEYPFAFSEEDGTGLEYNSFGGAWCLAATACYTWLTGDKQYLEGMLVSEKHYYDSYVSKCYCYGTPLDTSKAVDSEGILAYIRALRFMHAFTGSEYLLKHMRDGIEYEFTYKFIYNSPVKIPPLSTVGWSSCGGSITSTCNPHIHPMSSTIVDELMYYYKCTGDSYVYSRIQDTVLWGCQTYNTFDGEYGYGKKGWMSERFCYSQGLLTEHFPDGSLSSTWLTLMAWASGSILEGMAGDYWDNISN